MHVTDLGHPDLKEKISTRRAEDDQREDNDFSNVHEDKMMGAETAPKNEIFLWPFGSCLKA
jgi:hypothetical protein